MKFIPCEDCALRKMAPFKQFTTPELSYVSALKSGQIELPPRTVIIEPGKYDGQLFTLFSGWAYRYRVAPSGLRQIIDVLLPGSLIGLQQLMLGASDSGVESLTPVTLCVLQGRSLNEIFDDHSKLSSAMVFALMEDERRADRRIEMVAKQSGPERLAYFLLELVDRLQPLGLGNDSMSYFPLQRRHLADLLGLSDTHVSRSMTELRRDDLATIGANSLVIRNRAMMTKLSGYVIGEAEHQRLLL
ncbi:Crp/Fnr family transcriptional regulator [Sphingobium yanoikuyae]|uniref:Crp/Fnr family transcriptional regulator n=1 Tax=Sphingobium yanoikuyae TaxID=13690 RepID=A0A430BFT6_SPHYA|nr:Crp/Fnr family transcriptional regulator [Sphingobium yanoikuyae]RSU48384.1 Crp/Fnr family transcriptional regulator [Sphingobium yanoikuyae]